MGGPPDITYGFFNCTRSTATLKTKSAAYDYVNTVCFQITQQPWPAAMYAPSYLGIFPILGLPLSLQGKKHAVCFKTLPFLSVEDNSDAILKEGIQRLLLIKKNSESG